MITKPEFEAYEKVRESGKVNMFNVISVELMSGLDREKIREIMKDYSMLKKELV